MTETPNTNSQSEERTNTYAALQMNVWVAGLLIEVSIYELFIVFNWSLDLREWAFTFLNHPIGALCIFYSLLSLVMLATFIPLEVYSGYYLRRRFWPHEYPFVEWVARRLKVWGLGFLYGLVSFQILYFTLRYSPQSWWIYCSVIYMVYLFLYYWLTPLSLTRFLFGVSYARDAAMEETVAKLARGDAPHSQGVPVWRVKDEMDTSPYAGLGGTDLSSGIVVSDDLTKILTQQELEVVLAHELGHHKNHDIWRLSGWRSILAAFNLFLIHHALIAWAKPMGSDGPADFANLPLIAVVTIGTSLVLDPLSNIYSRCRERAADQYSLQVTGATEAFISMVEKVTEANLEVRKPAPSLAFLFLSHHSAERRIAFARSWRES